MRYAKMEADICARVPIPTREITSTTCPPADDDWVVNQKKPEVKKNHSETVELVISHASGLLIPEEEAYPTSITQAATT